MPDNMPSSKEFLKNSIQSHADLAKDLLRLTDIEAGETLNRFQIASIIILLAGVDKMLNIAFGLIYLAGRVGWNWMIPNSRFVPPAGFVECHRGLTAKIKKLKKFDVDITILLEVIELRNYFIHTSNIYVGFSPSLDESTMKPYIIPNGPVISYPLSPTIYWTNEVIDYYTNGIINNVSSFIDTTDWKKCWLDLTQKLEILPVHINQADLAYEADGHDKIMEKIENLNNEYIGVGLEKIL